jgi:3',5'-cyclic AMP phosphodiesterase CpdA
MSTLISHPIGRRIRVAIAVATLVFLTSCAKKGLLTEEYDAGLYEGVSGYEIGAHDSNPRFLAFGDTQAGWRVNEKLLRRENWVTKKAFIFPFYYLYNVGQGMVGTFNWLRSVPDYGGKERRLVRDAVFAEIQRTQPDFLLHLGDICLSDGRRPRHWETYLRESKLDVPLLTSVPVVPVIGNHERANDEEYGYPNFAAVFPEYPRFYVIDFPDLSLFVIDSNFIIDQKQYIGDEEQERLWRKWIVAPEGEEPAWLQRELARRDQRFKVVAQHHPPVSVGRHQDDWRRDDYGRDLVEKQMQLLHLLMDYGVQVVIAGHEHVYQHTAIRRHGNGDVDDAELHIVVTSGGGAPMRRLSSREEIDREYGSYSQDNLIVDLVTYVNVHHYSVVTVDSDSLVIDTFEAVSGDRLLERVVVEGD